MTSLDDKSTPLQTSQKWGLLRKTSVIVLTIFCYIHSVKHRKRKQIVCQSKRQHPMPLICFQRRCLRHVVCVTWFGPCCTKLLIDQSITSQAVNLARVGISCFSCNSCNRFFLHKSFFSEEIL